METLYSGKPLNERKDDKEKVADQEEERRKEWRRQACFVALEKGRMMRERKFRFRRVV